MRNISFLLFDACTSPGGGYKIIFEHANRLVAQGYIVNIICPASINWSEGSLYYKAKCIYGYFLRKYKKSLGYDCHNWFNIDKRVKFYWTYSLNYRHVPKSDVYIATEVRTSTYLNSYPVDNSSKFYFIQDFENWFVSEEYVRNTYHYKMNKIVITNWLKNIIEEEGESCTIIPNGFNFEEFKLTNPVESRDRYTLSMLYHLQVRKDCNTAIKAIEIVKQRYPQLKVLTFGSCPNPGLPEWFVYYQKPSSNDHLMINNNASIYVGSSKVEGFGLTIGEAMLCGEAVACTDNLGYREMAKQGATALLSPIQNPQALADNIITLIENDELRCKLAYNGLAFIKENFDWGKSSTLFRQVLNDR